MSNLWFNIRFGSRHFQLDNEWKFSFRQNRHWIENPPSKWFAIYTFFGQHYE